MNDATTAVLEFLNTQTNRAKWEKNGVKTPDSILASVRNFVLMGCHYPIFEAKNENEKCGKLAYSLALAGLVDVDWAAVLDKWVGIA